MSIKDNIKGFVPTSLVDWDGKVASVIFLAGCNFRCGYCSNKDLVLSPEKLKAIKFEDIKKYLEKNKDFVDGVVITGGEPTIYKDFPELCKEIKNLGFKVVLSDLFSNIKEQRFGIIIFNPPYLPLDRKEPKSSRSETTGGKKGNELAIKFLKEEKGHLNKNGKIFLITSSLAESINFNDAGYKYKLVSEKKLFFEKLFVWELSSDRFLYKK